jgi:cobalt-zinc-cadmium efflux system protein
MFLARGGKDNAFERRVKDMEPHHHVKGGSTKPLALAMVVTAAFALVEVIGGLVSESLALLSDAGHMFTDVLALGLSLGAAMVATRMATERHTFGFHRVEIQVALVNGIVLVGISLMIIYEAVNRFYDPVEIDAPVMLAVAVAGLGSNLIGIKLLGHGAKENLNVRGAFLHMLGDLLSSVGVIIAALLIYYLQWEAADPLISIAIALIIIFGAYRLVSQAVSILLEAVPSHMDLMEVHLSLTELDGVYDVHHLHVWALSSGVYALSAHLVVNDQMVSDCSPILAKAEEMLSERYHITHSTLQLESDVQLLGKCKLDGGKRDDHVI